MARITRKQMKRDEFVSTVGRVSAWAEENARMVLLLSGAAVVLVAAGVLGAQYLGSREAKASALLARGMEMAGAPIAAAGAQVAPGGVSYASTGEKYRAVLDQMDAVIRTYPRTRAARLAVYYQGLAYANLGKNAEAVAALERFLDRDPDTLVSPMARAALARALEEAGQPDRAVAIYRDLAEGRGGAYPVEAALFEMGLTLERMGKSGEAREVFERITRDHPASDYSREAEGRLRGST
jgi:tetratricopeptide (TPR) repeat protein